MYRNILIAILVSWVLPATAQLSVPKIIGNCMVLQQAQAVPVWGRALPGSSVTVSFNGQEKKAVAAADSNWKLLLDPMRANRMSQEMVIHSGSQSIVLTNILIGEVWLCSGQSNMEYSMRKNSKVTVPQGVTDWPVNELETAHNPSIRIFLVDRKKMKSDSTHAGWSVAEDSALRSFSAVGYFFAKKLFAETGVPVGVIAAAIPGSRIEPWMPREALAAEPFFRDQSDSTHAISGDPGKFYYSMIAPLVPFSIKGFLWYQGESNCFLNERIQYAYKMKALIRQWRMLWNNDRLPFYYVQIAPFAYSKAKGPLSYSTESLPAFWEAQALALKIPYTAMAATTDLNTDQDNLHPHYKWEIGRRLALCALANVYGRKDSMPMGPIYREMHVQGNTASISFDFAGKGLVSRNNQPLKGFIIAGKDGKFADATAVIDKNTVELTAPGVDHPVTVRFDWNEAAHPDLYNKEGLPAFPFRTDNPLVKEFK